MTKKKAATNSKPTGPKMDRYSDLLRRTIRHVRKRMKISQADLATLAGIEQSSLSKFEKGTRNLSEEAQQRIIAALDQAKAYAKADVATNWGMDPFSGPFSLGMKLALRGASPEPTPVQRMSKQMREEDEALRKEQDKFVSDSIAKSPEEVAKLVQENKELRARIEEQNQRLAKLTEAGYAIFPKSMEQERDDLKVRVANLEEEYRALKERAEMTQMKGIPLRSLLHAGPDTPAYEHWRERQRLIADIASREEDIAEGLHLLSEGIRLLLEQLSTISHDERLTRIGVIDQHEQKLMQLLRQQDAERVKLRDLFGEDE
jgi:transcriptional regulator with XRE-family HTH domain